MKEKWNKYLQQELSKKDKEDLLNALKEEPSSLKELAGLKNIVALTELLPHENDRIMNEQGWSVWKKRQQKRVQSKKINALVRYAGTIAATILIMVGINQSLFTNNEYTEIKVPKGQRVHLTLSDGSDVWLSSLSTLRFPSNFAGRKRHVQLDGEGFFNVKKANGKPFIVETNKYNVEVLGTSFNLYAYNESEKFEANLVTGKIQLTNITDSKEQLTLLPNEKAFLGANGLIKENARYHGNKYLEDGIYVFEAQTLEDIFERLEQWYDIEITITKPEILPKTISGKFRQSDQIESILAAIYRTDLFKYEIISCNKIRIY